MLEGRGKSGRLLEVLVLLLDDDVGTKADASSSCSAPGGRCWPGRDVAMCGARKGA